MAGNLKEIKKKISEEWQSAFPQLTLYSQNKFYKVVGAIIIGIELIKLPRTEEYRPHFVMYSLCGNRIGIDLKSCLEGPILLKEYYSKKKLQYSIGFEKHNYFFSDVLESIKAQTILPFEGNISFNKIASVIDEYSKTPPLSAAPNSYLQAALQEAKLKIALFISIEEAQIVLDQINKRSWDLTHFKACGVNVNEWLQSLQTIIINRDKFIKQIEANKQDKKILQLKSSEFTA
jgi:hypothetical protein